MMVACVKCKKNFDGSAIKRKCKECVVSFARSQLKEPFIRYVARARMHFQDPVYQFFRLDNDEDLRFSKLYYTRQLQNT